MASTVDKTIFKIVENGLCTGCGTCAGICPVDAIEMVIDHKKGIYIPQIDEEKCNQCGLCFEVCPGHSVDFKQLNLEIFGKEPDDTLIGNYLNCYIGHATDYDVRYNSASGGLVTALLIYALEERMIDGALVTRMKKNKPLEPEPFIARTKDEIIEAAKSKYCPVPANIALKEILHRDGKFAVVGLPCHVQGVRKAEQVSAEIRERVVLRLGLVCNHTPTFLATEYLLQKLGISKVQVTKISYRGDGWPGQMTVVAKDSTKAIPHFADLYWGFTFQNFFYPVRCTTCFDKVSELADISFMDAWLPELSKHRIGESLIVSRSQMGQELIQSARVAKLIEINKVPRDKVMQSQSLALVSRQRSAGLSLLKQLGKAVPVYHRRLPRVKLTEYLRTALFYLQISISRRRHLWFLVEWHSVVWRLARFSKRKLKETWSHLFHFEGVY